MSKEYNDFIKYVNFNKLGLIEVDADLKKYCTFGIGGKCYCVYKPDSIENLLKAYHFILRKKIDYFVIGNGSNLLISDDFHFKVFIYLKGLNQIELHDDLVNVSAGVMGNVLAKKLSEKNLHGIEFLAGIPGTIGGIVYMNAGAWDKSISDVLESVTYIDELGKMCVMNEISNKGFGYRKSPFMKRQVIILSCVFKLTKDIFSINLYNDYLNKKKNTQPLKEHSAGCAFKNPLNLSAWQLIRDSVGIICVNDAAISDVHANFIINKHHASFNDVKLLLAKIKEAVLEKHDIVLETEYTIIE